MVLRKRRQLALEYRRQKWRESQRRRREREKERRRESGWVSGQNDPAYEPTPEEIAAHCAEFRRQHMQKMSESGDHEGDGDGQEEG